MDVAALQQSQTLTVQFKAGGWQAPVTRMVPEGDARLKLGAISVGAKSSFAMINGKTLAEGEGHYRGEKRWWVGRDLNPGPTA